MSPSLRHQMTRQHKAEVKTKLKTFGTKNKIKTDIYIHGVGTMSPHRHKHASCSHIMVYDKDKDKKKKIFKKKLQ